MISNEDKTKILEYNALGLLQREISPLVGCSVDAISRLLVQKKRIVVIGDSHCGHESGLTPPKWQNADHQAEIWDWFVTTTKALKPDVLFVLGDMIDGKGKRSGGTELITTDRLVQVEMATEVISVVGCPEITMVFGTPYHTGDEEDYETLIAKAVGAYIVGHAFPICNGIQFDLKHKIGGSTIPHGRSTPLQKALLWNKMWHDHNKEQPNADIIIRGHVHYHEYTGNSQGLAMTCPALQGWGSKFGVRQCEGIVDTGLLWFDIRPGETLDTLEWHSSLPKFNQHHCLTYEV